MDQIAIILGARGSIPVSGSRFARYGCATTSIFLRLAGQPLILDAGNGLLGLPDVLLEGERSIPLLLSHPHADHLLGLPMCPATRDPSFRFDVYAVPRNGMDARVQICALMSPPLWPVGPETLSARIHFHDFPSRFSLGPIMVERMDGVHPGGVALMRLTGGGKRVVFATDCTLTDALFPELAAFSRDCDLLLIDGQYSPSEWGARRKFGHSTWTSAADLGRQCGAKQVRVIHHDPFRTDRELDEAASTLAEIHPNCTFAYEGEDILL